MSRCAVQIVWIMVNHDVDVAARDRHFDDQIAPSVRALPGFVQGVWARSADGNRTYNTIVFDDRIGADTLIDQIETNKPFSAAAGVHLHSLEVLDVTGSF